MSVFSENDLSKENGDRGSDKNGRPIEEANEIVRAISSGEVDAIIVEDAGGASFRGQATQLLSTLTSSALMFNPAVGLRASIAPTEHDPWRGRRLIGEVHDENCWALGGAAGHAGLFGTAQAVGDFARVMLRGLDGTDA